MRSVCQPFSVCSCGWCCTIARKPPRISGTFCSRCSMSPGRRCTWKPGVGTRLSWRIAGERSRRRRNSSSHPDLCIGWVFFFLVYFDCEIINKTNKKTNIGTAVRECGHWKAWADWDECMETSGISVLCQLSNSGIVPGTCLFRYDSDVNISGNSLQLFTVSSNVEMSTFAGLDEWTAAWDWTSELVERSTKSAVGHHDNPHGRGLFEAGYLAERQR